MIVYQNNFHAVLIGEQFFSLLLIYEFRNLSLSRRGAHSAGPVGLGLGNEEIVAFDTRLVGHKVLKLSDGIANHLQRKIMLITLVLS